MAKYYDDDNEIEYEKVFEKFDDDEYTQSLFKKLSKITKTNKSKKEKEETKGMGLLPYNFKTKEDEREYRRIRDELVSEYMGLAESLSKRYADEGKNLNDIKQEAYIQLSQSVSNYKLGKGYTFMTYATPCIIGAIKRFFRDNKGDEYIMRIPRPILKLAIEIKDATVILEQKYNRKPTEIEIAEHLNVKLASVREALSVTYALYNPESLDIIHGAEEGSGGTLMDTLCSQESYEANIISDELIKRYTRTFSDRDYIIFTEVYFEGLSQQKVADKLGINQTTVGRNADKLRTRFVTSIMEDFTSNFTDTEYNIFMDVYADKRNSKEVAKEYKMKMEELEILKEKLKQKFLVNFYG